MYPRSIPLNGSRLVSSCGAVNASPEQQKPRWLLFTAVSCSSSSDPGENASASFQSSHQGWLFHSMQL
ncbi:uncharacterized protein ACO6RY_06791 [Pungitius sinensis]